MNGYAANDTVCVSDSSGQGNLKCAADRKIGVITEMQGMTLPDVDGIIGIGRMYGSNGSNRT
jgi:hypothetical protein